jgi:hypothetical protein
VAVAQNVGTFQPVCKHEVLIVKDLRRWTLGHYLPAVENDHARADFDHEFQVVGRNDLGHAQTPENSHELASAARIKAAGRFVQHQDAHVARQQPGQADTALLSVAEMMGLTIFKSLQADALQRPPDAVGEFRLSLAQLLRPEGDVLPDRRAEQLIVRILKQQTDLRTNCQQVRLRHRRAEDMDGGGTRRTFGEKAVEVQEQGGLAGPVRADDTDSVAVADLETHVAQRLRAIGVAITEVVDLQGAHVCHPRAHIAA